MSSSAYSPQPTAYSLPGLFIAGTSTAVGKTHVGAMIARSLVVAGGRVGVYKPVASGCRRDGALLVADDAAELWEAAGRPGELEQVCPQRFLAPLAPPRAAAEEGRTVDETLLRSGIDYWLRSSDIVLVEGAGGLMSPLGDSTYNIDLAAEFGYPLLIVAANQLGVINALLQTVITAQARAPQLPIAGVVLNQAAPCAGDASLTLNADDIRKRCEARLLGCVARGANQFDPHINWYALADLPTPPRPPSS
jgi:dethiobiotin synthetase